MIEPSAPSARLSKLQHRLWRTERAATAYERTAAHSWAVCSETPSVCMNFPFLLLWYFNRSGRNWKKKKKKKENIYIYIK